MRARDGFRSAGPALLRAAVRAEPDLPDLPDPDDPSVSAPVLVEWLRGVWADAGVAEALGHASPGLAAQVQRLCAAPASEYGDQGREVRRAVLSAARYLRRMAGRATPFGLLAGVAPVSFGPDVRVRFGAGQRVTAHAAAGWLAEVITRLEGYPALLDRLPVVANTALAVRGDRLLVPHQPQPGQGGARAATVLLRRTAPVRAAIEAARDPIRFGDLVASLETGFPSASSGKVRALVSELVMRRALITGLHAPSIEADALGYLVRQLAAAGAGDVPAVARLVRELTRVHALLTGHAEADRAAAAAIRSQACRRMRCLHGGAGHPLALDLRLDAEVVLPPAVAREAERAALLLTRLSAFPKGTPAWRDYHQQFYERFGLGALVPLAEVVSDSGIGWPDGYPGTARPGGRSPLSERDEALLALAQQAALDGCGEVILDEPLIQRLESHSGPPRVPAHLEVAVRVRAANMDDLRRGDFQVEVVTVSRAAGVLTGRFLGLLGEAGDALAAGLAGVPCGDDETVAAQLSFPPLDPATTHVTRAPRTLPLVISLAEHHDTAEQVLTPADLAIGCDGRRMYLAAPALGTRVEATGLHALNLIAHTPPLARLITEVSRAQYAQVTAFSWGAASRLPFLPRLRCGRIIVSLATWRLDAAGLPEPVGGPRKEWDEALAAWRLRYRVPGRVYVVEGDRHLLLDLEQAGHRALLRARLNRAGHAVLAEAPAPGELGWCGGRAHEIIVPVTAAAPPRWPRLPAPVPARVTSTGLGCAPAASRVLLASLYGDIARQDTILAEHLPGLLGRFETEPDWWFIRYRDPDPHLRLRLALPGQAAFGAYARVVSTWAGELNRAGLLREVRYPTSYPETGRWGSGRAWAAAEDVFRADSRAVLAQLRTLRRSARQALAAAHFTAIAAAFTGSTAAGMRWLISHVPSASPARIARQVLAEAVRIADPSGDWAALRAAPGGEVIADGWKARSAALAAYRLHLPGPDTAGVAADDVLSSLLHVHYVRSYRIDFDDEAVCLYLARAAAMAWAARNGGAR